ncbi:unnamed protein product [Soboliphyme baturini]|uniref:Transposase n=1 Tax=Soboliphyme baturini TaxID=241478 RepID=A0A183IBM8_9BILA|nr:unnamed protein product [Soboliphyme baturini]
MSVVGRISGFQCKRNRLKLASVRSRWCVEDKTVGHTWPDGVAIRLMLSSDRLADVAVSRQASRAADRFYTRSAAVAADAVDSSHILARPTSTGSYSTVAV